jgi:hypothetical protein
MIAIDRLSGVIVWHPHLARQIPTWPYGWFVTDKNCQMFRRGYA